MSIILKAFVIVILIDEYENKFSRRAFKIGGCGLKVPYTAVLLNLR